MGADGGMEERDACLSFHVRWPDNAFNRLSLGLPCIPCGSYYLFPGIKGRELVGSGLDTGL